MSKSWLYALSNPSLKDNFNKIGHSINPDARAKDLSKTSGVILPYKVEFAIEIPEDFQNNPGAYEKIVHNYFENYRVTHRREAFEITLEEIRALFTLLTDISGCSWNIKYIPVEDIKPATGIKNSSKKYNVLDVEIPSDIHFKEWFDKNYEIIEENVEKDTVVWHTYKIYKGKIIEKYTKDNPDKNITEQALLNQLKNLNIHYDRYGSCGGSKNRGLYRGIKEKS